MNRKTERLKEFIRLAESRPGFFFSGNPTYNELSALIFGYFEGLWEENENPLDFSMWLQETHGHQTGLHWQAYIYLILAKEDDEKAKKLLFERLRKYCEILAQE